VTVSDFSERDLIARFQRHLAPPPDWLLVGIGDDAAVVETERNRAEVLTVDGVVDGIHFDRAFVPPDAIGHRALAVNLSDLAAMGAKPRLALVAMALPAEFPVGDFDAIACGLATLASTYGLHVVGGNLTRTPGPLSIDVTVVGTVKPRQALRRSGARAGDDLYVTGSIGGAAAGLEMLRDFANTTATGGRAAVSLGDSSCVARYLRPDPRVRIGTLLGRNRVASACMDLSDGLADAVRQLAAASGVGARLDGAALPIEPAARDWFASRGVDPLTAAVTRGDDYELLIAVRPRLKRQLAAVIRHADVPLTRVGVCTPLPHAEDPVTIDGQPMSSGYSHFR
jgi:thiamine-monophosphate kinase